VAAVEEGGGGEGREDRVIKCCVGSTQNMRHHISSIGEYRHTVMIKLYYVPFLMLRGSSNTIASADSHRRAHCTPPLKTIIKDNHSQVRHPLV